MPRDLPFGSAVSCLDTCNGDGYRRCMSQSILLFDFGTNEDAAQQARHKVEAWKQSFRLGDKMLLKFEREEPPEEKAPEPRVEAAEKKKPAKKKSAARGGKSESKASDEMNERKEEKPTGNAKVRLLLRLDFSDHEKLSHQRWLDRIPIEEPFKSAKAETIRSSDPAFTETAERFDSLD
jgi:hypothetical protein